jgi:hypothetical protein
LECWKNVEKKVQMLGFSNNVGKYEIPAHCTMWVLLGTWVRVFGFSGPMPDFGKN